jgi:predicted HNH restriction endonuclease
MKNLQILVDMGGMGSYYRIELEGYKNFDTPFRLGILTEQYRDDIGYEIAEDDPSNYPFTKKDPLKLKQGKYLTQCTERLFRLLEECKEIGISTSKIGSESDTSRDSNSEDKRLQRDTSHDLNSEGKRLQRETYFFARNPELVKKAKKVRGSINDNACEACGFKFRNKYGAYSDGYIECHHINPLSERPEKERGENILTSINDVRIVCSNCHRMIHHKRPALPFEELVKLLKRKT